MLGKVRVDRCHGEAMTAFPCEVIQVIGKAGGFFQRQVQKEQWQKLNNNYKDCWKNKSVIRVRKEPSQKCHFDDCKFTHKVIGFCGNKIKAESFAFSAAHAKNLKIGMERAAKIHGVLKVEIVELSKNIS